MDRKEFLTLASLGLTSLICGACLSGCSKDSNPVTAPSNVDFTLDMSDPSNAALTSNGGYLVKNDIIVVHTGGTTYYALSSKCTHQGATVQFDAANNRVHCPAHQSNFATNGTVINGPASSALKTYNTSLSGNSLRVFS